MMPRTQGKKKRRLLLRRKRSLDPSIIIDYKKPDGLKRFVTDRGKIIPRRISGATAKQQREICTAVKRARFLSLLPFSLAHRTERRFSGEMTAAVAAAGISTQTGQRHMRMDSNREPAQLAPQVAAPIPTIETKDEKNEE